MKTGWLIGLLLIATNAFSQGMMTKVIELQYVQAKQVTQLIQPLLQPGEKISGSDQTLIVSVSPQTLSQIRIVLHRLDVPPVTFKVSIYQGNPRDLGDHSDTIYSTKPQSEVLRSQSVMVMNGESAMVSTGLEVPIITALGSGYGNGPVTGQGTAAATGAAAPAPAAGRPGRPNNPNSPNNIDGGFIAYEQHNIENGLLVKPVLQGSQVKLSVKRMREQQNAAGGQQFDNQRFNTTLMVPLNKWVSLGSAEGESDANVSSTSYTAGRPFSGSSTLYIKITIVNSTPSGDTK